MTVGQVIAKLGVDPKEYEKGLKQAEKHADKAGSKIGSIFKNAFSVTLGMGMFKALEKGFKSTVSTAIDFNSMLQTARIGFTTMLGSAEKAQSFLDDMAKFAAKTPFEYPELLDAAKKMLAYGFAAENVLPTLRAVGDAAAALGAGNEGIDRITLALGQIRAKGRLSAEEMRQLTEAGIPAWHMLAEAMGTTVPELQKMVSKGLIPGYKAVEMLTSGMTKRFGGMMASMEDTWQGVTSSIKDIWRMTVGTLTQNLFSGLNAMLIKVRDFLQEFYTMVQAVFGKKAQQTTEGLTASTEAQAAAIVDVGDAIEDAAKKARKGLIPFDEIHKLQEDMSEANTGDMFAMPTAGEITPLEVADIEEPKNLAKMQGALEKLKDLLVPAINSFKNLKTAAEPIIKNIGDGLKWFYESVLLPVGQWAVGEALPAWLDALAAALGALNPIIEIFKPAGEWLWNNFLIPAGNFVGDAVITYLNTVTDALQNLGGWLEENKEKIQQYGAQTIENINETLANVKDLFSKIWTNIIAPVLIPALDMLKDVWDNHLKGLIQKVGEFVVKLYNSGLEIYNKFIKPIVTWFVETLGPIIVNIVKGGINHIGSILKSIIDAGKGIMDALSGIIDFVTGVFTGNWKKAWEGVKKAVKGIFDGLVAIVKAPINTIINGVNTMIRGLNKFSIDIPDWLVGLADVVGIKGGKFGFNIPEIPTLGKGGLVTQPTMAIIGEAGTEAVMPLERNTGWIDELARKIATTMQGLQTAGASAGGGDIYVYIGNEQIDAYIHRSQDRRNIRSNGR